MHRRERWDKAASMAVALLMLATALSGSALFLASFGSSAGGVHGHGGDWLITDEVEVTDHISHGNITISGAGVLKVSGGRLLMASNHLEGRELTITVRDGGTLHLDNALLGALLTFTDGCTPTLAVRVENGGRLIAENGSVIKFPGHLLVDRGELIVKDSTIRGMDGSAPEDETGDIGYYCDPDVFPAERFGHSPVIALFSSHFLLQNSSILDMQEGLPLDPGVWTADYGFVSDDGGRDEVTYQLDRHASSFAGAVDPEGLQSADGLRHVVASGEELRVEGFDLGGLVFNAGEADVALNAIYRAGAGFTGADLEYGRDGAMLTEPLASTLGPAGVADVEVSIPLTMASWELADLGLLIDNGGGADIELDRVWLSIEIALPAFRNLTLAGDSRLLLINSSVSVDHSGEVLVDPDDPPLVYTRNHNSIVVRDQSRAELYGFSCEPGHEFPFADAVEIVPRTLDLLPGGRGSGDTTANADVSGLFDEYANDGDYYDILPGEVMEVFVNTTGISGGLIATEFAVLMKSDATDPAPLSYIIDGVSHNTSILPDGTMRSYSFDLPLESFDDLESILIVYDNSDGDDTARMDRLAIRATTSPQAHIYKWADVTVLDGNGAPLAGAQLEAFTQDDGQQAMYLDGEQWSAEPPQEVLDYLGLGSMLTDASGKAMVPLLADRLMGSAFQPIASHSYHVVATAQTAGGPVTGQSGIQFKPYPYLSSGSNDDIVKPLSITIADAIADLELFSIELLDSDGDPVAAAPGDPLELDRTQGYEVAITIYNNGPVPVTGFGVSLYDGDTLIALLPVPYIGPYEDPEPAELALSHNWTAGPSGPRELRAVIEVPETVRDLDDTNNELAVDINVNPVPELIIGDPQRVLVGEESFFEVLLRNEGDADSGPFDVEYYVNGVLFSKYLGASLGRDGGEQTFRSPDAYAPSSPEPLVLKVVLASGNDYIDGIEATSDLTTNLWVEFDPLISETFQAGSDLALGYVIGSSGLHDAHDVTVKVELSEAGRPYELISESTVTIPAGETPRGLVRLEDVQPASGTLSSRHELRVTINEEKMVPETGYDDNVDTLSFTVVDDGSGSPADRLLLSDAVEIHDQFCYQSIHIVSGGNLSIVDGSLRMVSDHSVGRQLSIVVGNGGVLHLDNASIGAYMGSVSGASPLLSILVENGGSLILRNGSTLAFPGHILIDNGSLELYDSSIRGMRAAYAGDPMGDIAYYCDSDLFPSSAFSHSAVLVAVSSDVVLVNSSIEDVYRGGAVSPSAGIDYKSFVIEDDESSRVFYTLNRYPFQPTGTATGTVSDLFDDDGEAYTIAQGEDFTIGGFDSAGLLFERHGAIGRLNIQYRADLATDVTVYLKLDGSDIGNRVLKSTRGLTGLGEATISIPLYGLASWDLSALTVEIDNDGGADIEIERLWFSVTMPLQSYRNITMAGDSRLTVIDSMLSVDHSGSSPAEHSSLVLRDSAKAYLYGVVCSEGYRQPFQDAIVIKPTTLAVPPAGKAAGDGSASGLSSLWSSDGVAYEIEGGEGMRVVFDLDAIADEFSDLVLSLRSLKGPVYDFNNPVIKYQTNGGALATGLQPTEGLYEAQYRIPGASGISGELTVMYDASADTEFDMLSLRVSSSPAFFVYKWADVYVHNGLQPLEGAAVEVRDQLSGQKIDYRSPDGVSATPPQIVIDHLGRADYDVTDASGRALIPVLVQVEDALGSRVSTFIVHSTMQAQGGPVTASQSLAFDIYPFLHPGSNADVRKEVSILMGSALADLTVTDLELLDRDGNPMAVNEVDRTDVVDITFNVVNQGPVAAPAFSVSIYDGETLLATIPVGGLGFWTDVPGRTVALHYEWTATRPLGDHDIRIVIDVDGEVTESDRANNVEDLTITVLASAELSMGEPRLSIEGDDVFLVVDIENIGDEASGAFGVDFLVNGASKGTEEVAGLAAGGTTRLKLPYVQSAAGPLEVEIVISSSNPLLDGIRAINDLSVDLAVANVEMTRSQYVPGEWVSANILVSNDGAYGASGVKVVVKLYQEGVLIDTREETLSYVSAGGNAPLDSIVWRDLNPDTGATYVNYRIDVSVNPEMLIPETNFSNNEGSLDFRFKDERADLFVTGMEVSEGDDGPVGKPMLINVTVRNIGLASGSGASLRIYLVGSDTVQIVNTTLAPIARDSDLVTSLSWTIRGDPGDYEIRAVVNENGAVPDRNPHNDFDSVDFEITPLVPTINPRVGTTSYKVGEDIYVWGTVRNAHNSNETITGAPVTLKIYNGGELVATYLTTTGAGGTFNFTVPCTEMIAGNPQFVFSTVQGAESSSGTLPIKVASAIGDGGMGWMVWILIALVMLFIVIIFSYYIYRYSLGKMVECGECHSLIPEASHRCPNCGVDFEVGTAKCSECGSWIPSNSKKCPECGVSFIGTIISDEEESDYIQLMREGYGLFVDVYRDQAREDMGKKYNDQRFLRWWTEHPEYITFEEWLSKEESERKEQTFKCPSCGTVNAKGAKQCVRCNRSFTKAEEELTDEEEKPAPIRRIVRRRKAVKEEAAPADEEGEPEPRKRSVIRKEESVTEPEEKPAMKKRAILRREPEQPAEEPQDEVEATPEEAVADDEPEPAAEAASEEHPDEEAPEEAAEELDPDMDEEGPL